MQLIKLNQTRSTNEILKNIAQKYPLKNGTVVVADYQTKGKGQQGTHWHSERGKNLTFSTVFFFKNLPAEKIPYLNYATSLSIYEILKELIPEKLFIKWPNDLMVRDKKIAGILIENTLKKENVLHSIIGIGLNVNQQKFPEKISATSLKNETKKQDNFDRDLLLKKIIASLKEKINFIEKKEYQKIKKSYLAKLYKFNTASRFFTPQKGVFTGTITGINTAGFLEILESNGHKKKYDKKEIVFV